MSNTFLMTEVLIGLPDLWVEWLKCWVRAACWKKEIQLLEEEMCCAIKFCMWKVNWWEEQACHQTWLSPHLAEGVAAYAAKHTATEHHQLID